jgi:hypothetical protein
VTHAELGDLAPAPRAGGDLVAARRGLRGLERHADPDHDRAVFGQRGLNPLDLLSHLRLRGAFCLAAASQSLALPGGCTLYVRDPIVPIRRDDERVWRGRR